jgi:hypothetical protein
VLSLRFTPAWGKLLAGEKAHGWLENISVVVWAAFTELDHEGSRGGSARRQFSSDNGEWQ